MYNNYYTHIDIVERPLKLTSSLVSNILYLLNDTIEVEKLA
jgi:hypothetical protein